MISLGSSNRSKVFNTSLCILACFTWVMKVTHQTMVLNMSRIWPVLRRTWTRKPMRCMRGEVELGLPRTFSLTRKTFISSKKPAKWTRPILMNWERCLPLLITKNFEPSLASLKTNNMINLNNVSRALSNWIRSRVSVYRFLLSTNLISQAGKT